MIDALSDRDAGIPGFRPPRQDRSRATLARLTAAVGDLLLYVEPGEVSVRELVARADTSVGAFYARFDDREAAFSYTSHAFWAESRRIWVDYLTPVRWDGCSAACIVVTVIRTMARTLMADGDRLRGFLRLSLSLPDSGILDRVAEHDRFIASTLAALLAARGGEIRHAEPRAAAEAGFRHVMSAMRDSIVYRGVGGGDPQEPPHLILSLCQMYGRYLDVHPVPEDYGDLLGLVRRDRTGSADHTPASGPTA